MSQDGYVYLLQGIGTNYVKVGKSVQPFDRQKILEQGVPFELRLLMCRYVKNMDAEETYLKRLYAPYNTRGEWFAFPQDMLERFYTIDLSATSAWSPESSLAPIQHVTSVVLSHEALVALFQGLITRVLELTKYALPHKEIRYWVFYRAHNLLKTQPALESLFEDAFALLRKTRGIVTVETSDTQERFVTGDSVIFWRNLQRDHPDFYAAHVVGNGEALMKMAEESLHD